jgi:BirA family biotin operon repressor/biotin-[acetyl-CoA-carboxylase] ligase
MDVHGNRVALSCSGIGDACLALPMAQAGTRIAIELVDETGSTNADLLARLDGLDGLNDATLLIALHQHAGRGRAGRNWLSAAGASLTFSLAWPFQGPLHKLLGLPLAVGVALAECMAALGQPVTLKWPNDVHRDGHKLAGILIETRSIPGQGQQQGQQRPPHPTTWAVIGIGINLTMPDALEQQIGHAVAAAPWLAQMDRNVLMATLLGHLTRALSEFEAAGFSAFCARWNRLDAYRGQQVVITDRGQVLHEGTAAGVDDFGQLLLDSSGHDSSGGRIAIVSGDVTLRVKQE